MTSTYASLEELRDLETLRERAGAQKKLWLAAAENDAAGVRSALRRGADAQALNIQLVSAVVLAASKGATESLTALLSAQDLSENPTERSWISALGVCAFSDSPECLALLLAAGADPNAHDAEGATPLQRSAESNNARITGLLLAAGARVGPQGISGNTPLMHAAFHGSTACALALIKGGDSFGPITHGGRTAGDLAREGGHPQLAALLDGRALAQEQARDLAQAIESPRDAAALAVAPRTPRI